MTWTDPGSHQTRGNPVCTSRLLPTRWPSSRVSRGASLGGSGTRGLVLECPEAAAAIQNGDQVSVDYATGVITDHTTGQTFQATALPPFIEEIVAHGGLLPYLKARQEAGK